MREKMLHFKFCHVVTDKQEQGWFCDFKGRQVLQEVLASRQRAYARNVEVCSEALVLIVPSAYRTTLGGLPQRIWLS